MRRCAASRRPKARIVIACAETIRALAALPWPQLAVHLARGLFLQSGMRRPRKRGRSVSPQSRHPAAAARARRDNRGKGRRLCPLPCRPTKSRDLRAARARNRPEGSLSWNATGWRQTRIAPQTLQTIFTPSAAGRDPLFLAPDGGKLLSHDRGPRQSRPGWLECAFSALASPLQKQSPYRCRAQ